MPKEIDVQAARIKAARNLVHNWIKEAIERRNQALNAASRQNELVALYELRLQDLDDREAAAHKKILDRKTKGEQA